jgi:hypothetical protein
MCSYQFARSKVADVQTLPWDLVVIDEAHRLRNVYKKSNKIARTLRDAVGPRPKVLLTATPLQNSLMELFGLISFIDPHIFGSEESFREQFAKRSDGLPAGQFQNLRTRIQHICQRTLRRQVTEYIRYTRRISITQDFTPTDAELQLYESVSSYLQKPELFALPKSQRQLITLILRKILASSSFAIAATLGTMIARLEAMQAGNWVISKQYNAAMLAEAVCKLEGFRYAPSDTVYWQQGHSTEHDFICVTTQKLGPEQLQQLSEEVGESRTLLVMCMAFRGKPDRWGNLTVKKIPKAVLHRCEWGHDDYSLQVENLPKAPRKPGQMALEFETP